MWETLVKRIHATLTRERGAFPSSVTSYGTGSFRCTRTLSQECRGFLLVMPIAWHASSLRASLCALCCPQP